MTWLIPLVPQVGHSWKGKPPSDPRCILATTLLLSPSPWQHLPRQTSGPPPLGSHTCTRPHILVRIKQCKSALLNHESRFMIKYRDLFFLKINFTYLPAEQSQMHQMHPHWKGNNTKSIYSCAQLKFNIREVCVCLSSYSVLPPVSRVT